MSAHTELVSRLRAAWLSGKTRPMEYRVAQLEALGRFLDEKKQDILDATALDMGKPPFEVELSEISICRSELNHTLNNLGTWMKDKHVEKNWVWGSGWLGTYGMAGRCPSHHPSFHRRHSWTQPSSARTRMGWCSSSGHGTTPLTSSWCPSLGPSLQVRLGCVPAILGGTRTSLGGAPCPPGSGNGVMGPHWGHVCSARVRALTRGSSCPAGNCVVMKPSEISRNVERLVAETLPRYLDKDCFAVVTAGTEETTRLLENKFDYIFFTGSPSVGRIVMTAAAKHLTPVTLELGGKNPCYVSDTCNVQNVARRVAWGRFFNAGQTCVAPDYVLCSLEMQEKLLVALREAITEFYGPNPQESPDFARIVGDKHFQRVQALLRSGRVAIGGQTDAQTRYIAPTVLVDVQQDDPVMQEEIFGPILPILTVTSLDDAIAFINARERPLAIYVFSSCKKVVNQVLEKTSSGGFCANDTIMHMTLTSLPFGGIGTSIPGNKVLQGSPAHRRQGKTRALPAVGEILPRVLPALPSPTTPPTAAPEPLPRDCAWHLCPSADPPAFSGWAGGPSLVPMSGPPPPPPSPGVGPLARCRLIPPLEFRLPVPTSPGPCPVPGL
ncbi:aldehyde dehydrogenase family 3 member B1-like isoform X2 [Falco naumanni]|uniref:aldehyde dehydrogenase family 3 member B1-like isoform X2 n=1 Tax=Falco naumanni TaxID=148594 RepID=UPI001ADE4B49|nr:aldehyde dehydrogenase family 3 member B1-like isoform X2 [Falco naumanni]